MVELSLTVGRLLGELLLLDLLGRQWLELEALAGGGADETTSVGGRKTASLGINGRRRRSMCGRRRRS